MSPYNTCKTQLTENYLTHRAQIYSESYSCHALVIRNDIFVAQSESEIIMLIFC